MSDRCIVDPAWPLSSKQLPNQLNNVKRLPIHSANENIADMQNILPVLDIPASLTIIPPVTVFAKKDLATFCDRNEIRYNRYNTFADISAQLKKEGVW